jgi:hypothetical protein
MARIVQPFQGTTFFPLESLAPVSLIRKATSPPIRGPSIFNRRRTFRQHILPLHIIQAW